MKGCIGTINRVVRNAKCLKYTNEGRVSKMFQIRLTLLTIMTQFYSLDITHCGLNSKGYNVPTEHRKFIITKAKTIANRKKKPLLLLKKIIQIEIDSNKDKTNNLQIQWTILSIR